MQINNMEISEAEKMAQGMVQSAEKIANAIVDNNTKNAEVLREGFREVGKSLGGTKAELMMDVLLKQSEANGVIFRNQAQTNGINAHRLPNKSWRSSQMRNRRSRRRMLRILGILQ